VLLVYLDESYRRGRHYWLAACAVHDQEVAALCAGIQMAAARIPAGFGIPYDVELHAQHLFHGEKEFVPLKQAVRVRIQTYRRGLESLCSAGPGLLFVGVEWNEELPTHQRLSSHRLSALRHLIPAIESYCDARDERCLVVADEEETTTDEVVAVVREHQRSRAEEGTLSHMLDTPLFTQSHHSYGVQACDLAAFLRTRRALARPDEDARAKRTLAGLWSMVEPHVVEDACYSAPSATDVLLATGAATNVR
jgi:hypothetical protein